MQIVAHLGQPGDDISVEMMAVLLRSADELDALADHFDLGV
ncbi:MAG TPA: hypothetical protein VFE62_14025 [Gemmataceae bacterium]|nr:hypothetical protein [Gemmataceae bacterium]